MIRRKLWVISLVVTAILVLFACVTVFAETDEPDPGGEVLAISFTPSNSARYVLDYHTHGTMEGGTFHYDIPPAFRDGDCCYLTILTEEGDTIEKEYRCVTKPKRMFVEANSSEDTLPISFIRKSNVQTNSDGNYYVSVTCRDVSCTYPVTITRPVEIQYIPIDPVVFYVGEDYDPTTGTYLVARKMKFGDQLIITEEDGTKHTYVYGASEEEELGYGFICAETGDQLNGFDMRDLDVCMKSDQDSVPWEEGSFEDHPGNYMTVTYSELEYKIPIELISTPVESISFEPIEPFEFVENAGGGVNSDTGIYQYDMPMWREGDKVIVHFKDGTTETYTYPRQNGSEDPYWGIADRIEYMYEFPNDIYLIDTQNNDPWLPDKENHLIIAYRGKTCTVPVRIEPDPVIGFSFMPAHKIMLVENVQGMKQTVNPGSQYPDLEESITYFYYTDVPGLYPGDRISVEYSDGRGTQTYIWTQVSKYERVFVNENDSGDIIDTMKPGNFVYFQDDQSYKNPWLPNKDNEMTVTFHNFDCTVPVEIIPQTEEFMKAWRMKWSGLPEPPSLTETDKQAVLDMWDIYQGLSDGEQYAFDHQGGGYFMEDYMESCVVSGHSWGTPTYKWSSDDKTVTATRICKKDNTHKQSEKATVTSSITKKATYTAKGQTTYTAVFKNSAFKKQIKVKTDVPKLAKKAQPMTVSADVTKVKYGDVKKKAVKIKPIKVKKAKGDVTYQVVKGNEKSRKALSVNKKTGVVTVKKKTAKGFYVLTVKVTAAGTNKYKSGSKKVKVTVKVN